MNEDIMVDSTFLIETIVEKLKLLKSSLEKYGDSLEDKVKEIEMTIPKIKLYLKITLFI